jgi:hypothetical protein
MLVESLTHVGAARSIVIDEANGVLAGNGLLEAAGEAGITKLKVVEADGDTIVAVRRTGLTPEQKRALAMYDNRTGELGEWVPEQLAADKAGGLDLAPWFNPGEQRQQLGTFGPEPKVVEVETSTVGDQFWIAITGPLVSQAQALQRLRQLMGEVAGIEVELGTTPTPDAWTGPARTP